jgi:thiamine-phosphate diphosphorylase/hydroxyethylthiazole kinase
LHIGQTDLDPRTARKLLPPGSILGLSIGSQEEASRLLDQYKDEETGGALVDYVGIGAVWRTTSKDVSKKVMLGPEGVGKILDLLHEGSRGSIKSVAIGESSFIKLGLGRKCVLRDDCTTLWHDVLVLFAPHLDP